MEKTNLSFKTELSRQVMYRSQGTGQGPIIRLVSPSDIGQLIKPFVFLDWFDLKPSNKMLGFGYHPHSGIATFTTLLSGSNSYEDSTGKSGVMHAGDIEWMRAGKGVWHNGAPKGSAQVTGFQLWIALPPELEKSEPQSIYLSSSDVQTEGPARVLLGAYGNARSRISPGSPLNYLHVNLKDGERWFYYPPKDHDVAWVAVHEGKLETAGVVLSKEIAVFEDGDQAIEFVARGKTGFVLGSALKHPYPLVLGPSSVHTSPEALKESFREIRSIEERLHNQGDLS
jgi:redox-sensitive bicupin YhaK (pirin superfamily)